MQWLASISVRRPIFATVLILCVLVVGLCVAILCGAAAVARAEQTPHELTLDEALAMAQEAIELHLEGLIDEGQPVPRPGKCEDHQRKAQYRGGTWASVSVDPARLRVNAKRVNITVPERVLDAIDRFAEAHGQTRSRLLVEAATEYMGRAGEKDVPRARRGKSGQRGKADGHGR